MTKTLPINGKFQLVKLPYGPKALEPAISTETLSFHYGKHLKTYVNNLNALLPGSPYEGMALEDVVKKGDGAVFNNAGQVLNHQLYFTQFGAPKSGNHPSANFMKRIVADFGSFEGFKEEFEKKGTALFGSGWVWLSADNDGKLIITQEPNAGNPITKGLTPLLTFDVWEHAYYLDYQNRRPAYLTALWSIVNWTAVEARLQTNTFWF